MRTTVTLTPEAESFIKRLMQERNLSFKDAVNTAILQGSGGSQDPAPQRVTHTARMGRPRVPLEKSLHLAGELDDESLLDTMKLGK